MIQSGSLSGFQKTRSMILNFAVTDLRLRYKNSALGFVWTILEPLMMLGVLYFVFSTILKTEIENFPIYLLLSLIVWNMFANGTKMGLNSLNNRKDLVKQIYFPRFIPAISASLTAALMLVFEFTVLVAFMIIFQFTPPATVIVLPLILLLGVVLVFAVSLPLSVMAVRYKDVEFIWAVVVQAGFFLTPIFYQFSMLPEYLQNILQFSPMVQIVTMSQHLALYGTLPSLNSIVYAVSSVMVILIIGITIYKKMQERIVEEM